jgi:hypothetical protein|tara:strand:+ start:45 stop:479 length:435 start_codon:yes stop_codon:yes gene_type:complete
MSKSKAIGTKAETALRNYLLSTGYTELEAHRNVLTGSDDEGDVWIRDKQHGLIVFEVKGGKAAKEASHEQMKKWYVEAETEMSNAGASFGFLVTQRAGVGYPRAGEWWAYGTLGDIAFLAGSGDLDNNAFIRLTVAELVKLIRG